MAIMQLEEYFNFIAADDIRIKNSRIGIETILYQYIYQCQTPEEIAQKFHTVTLEQVYATILYYLQNKDTVSAYLADWLDFSRRMREEQQDNPSPARIRMRQLRAQKEINSAQKV